MAGWYIAESSTSASVCTLTVKTGKAKVTMSATPDSLSMVTPSEVNQEAATLICSVGGLSAENTVALLRAVKNGIDGLLEQLSI